MPEPLDHIPIGSQDGASDSDTEKTPIPYIPDLKRDGPAERSIHREQIHLRNGSRAPVMVARGAAAISARSNALTRLFPRGP